ncbi:MAG TPA: flagellar assembly protein FliW [Clostridia bacterium]|nr:flagellar assembly protein FliW [Clostridia bacterium]
MKVNTKFFGELEADEKDIISFEDNILGFPDLKEYLMVHDNKNEHFNYLQAIDDINVCFIITSPFFIIPDYSMDISADSVKKLELEEDKDVMLYSIVTIPEDIKQMTANMKAPLVVNVKNRKALQEVLDDERYSIKHRIVKEADASC